MSTRVQTWPLLGDPRRGVPGHAMTAQKDHFGGHQPPASYPDGRARVRDDAIAIMGTAPTTVNSRRAIALAAGLAVSRPRRALHAGDRQRAVDVSPWPLPTGPTAADPHVAGAPATTDEHADWDGLQPVHATGRKSPRRGQCGSGCLQARPGPRRAKPPGRSADGVSAAGRVRPGRREPHGLA